MDELTAALRKALDDQMTTARPPSSRCILNQELGEPFRRDAMKKPVAVAGIDPGRHAAAAVRWCGLVKRAGMQGLG